MPNIKLKNRYIIDTTTNISGGQSTVFLAKDNRFDNRTVAVKMYPLDNQESKKSYDIEKRILTTFENQYIPKAHDYDDNVSNGRYGAIIMDYFRGETLSELIRKNQVNKVVALNCITNISKIIDYCHNHSTIPIVYSDLKPENIIKTLDGRWCIVDFGSAIFLDNNKYGVSRGMGTRGFAPTELIERSKVSPATDVYSLASLYFLMKTGRYYTLDQQDALNSIMRKALHSDPRFRFDNIIEFANELNVLENSTSTEKLKCKVCGFEYNGQIKCPRCQSEYNSVEAKVSIRWELSQTKYNIVSLSNTPLMKAVNDIKFKPYSWKELRDYSEILSEIKGFEELISINKLNIELYEHQYKAVHKFLNVFRGSGILADEVGLGKTIEAGMIISELVTRGLAKRVLIIAPNHLVDQWREDMAEKIRLKFSVFDRSEFINQNLVIIPFFTFRISSYKELFKSKPFDIVICDEAHNLLTKSGISTAWYTINEMKRKYTVLLSATPIKRSLIDLFHLTTLVRPGEFKTEQDFLSTYRGYDSLSVRNVSQLKNILSKLVIRNKRRECARSWPNKISHPFIVKKDEKFSRLMQILNSKNDTLAIVFTSTNKLQVELFNRTKQIIRNRDIFVLTGSRQDKNATIRKFKASSNGVMFVDKNSSEGRNLQFCSLIVNYDISNNPIEMEQRIGRVYRIGQESDVHIYNLAETDSLESYLLKFYDEHLKLFSLWRGEIYEILGDTEGQKSVSVMAQYLWNSSPNKTEFENKWNAYIKEIIQSKQDEDEEELKRDKILDILF